MIDLHMHTTASDGRCTPDAVVAEVAEAGVTTFSITDHDTVAAWPEASAAASARGLTLVSGIEITAVWQRRDVHVLGYWCRVDDPDLGAFLVEQRARRVERVQRIAHALAAAGAPIDVTPLLDDAALRPGAAVGRPGLARALVAAGHAHSITDAFDRLLGDGCPAYVPRTGVAPEEVFAIIHAAGGIASIAHPGVTNRDDMLEQWVAGGADAIEVFHSDHDDDARARYLAAASVLGVPASGGSDFHGLEPRDGRHGRRAVGGTTLPMAHWTALQAARAARSR